MNLLSIIIMLKKSLFFVSLDSEMVHTDINDKERKKHTTDHTYIYTDAWKSIVIHTVWKHNFYIWEVLRLILRKKMTQTLNLKTSSNIHETIAFQWFWGCIFFVSDNRRTQTCPNQKEKHCLAIRDTDTKIIKYSSAIWKP